ncbi:hypothetical protein SRRS_47810 [Sporomusa rhizae]|uniref:SAM-dependent methyltransferase n=1 Tax=Sporomusa rhizae TaxID=357999 RepID=UPI003529EA80
MTQFYVKPIGKIRICDEGMFVDVDKQYIQALKELKGFSHLVVLWWFTECDTEKSRSILEIKNPYKNAPAVMGTFATRSPERPNPVAISTAEILYLDEVKGVIQIAYIDANDGSPIIDLKPYTPSLDRVQMPGVPAWCSHWPKSLEESGKFDWENELNF